MNSETSSKSVKTILSPFSCHLARTADFGFPFGSSTKSHFRLAERLETTFECPLNRKSKIRFGVDSQASAYSGDSTGCLDCHGCRGASSASAASRESFVGYRVWSRLGSGERHPNHLDVLSTSRGEIGTGPTIPPPFGEDRDLIAGLGQYEFA